MVRLLLAVILALGIAAPTFAGPDPQRHALTVPIIEKLQAAHADMEKLPKPKGAKDDEDEKDLSVEDVVKLINSTPGAKPILARHGLTAENYALGLLALFNAGFFVAMEPSMDKKGAAKLFSSYPKEMQGNIELLRRNPKLLKAQ